MKLKKLLRPIATTLALTVATFSATAADHEMDIVDTASTAGIFGTLTAALSAANLVDVLKGEGPFTVFAPSDDAFSKLPDGTVENLLKPENIDQLVGILTYHVVPGKIFSTDIMMGSSSVATVQGSSVIVMKDSSSVKVNQATVVAADIKASNGVIHVIDEVILPK
jgi:uncharacterized surface protein with fasciclin (FAS1) repeats